LFILVSLEAESDTINTIGVVEIFEKFLNHIFLLEIYRILTTKKEVNEKEAIVLPTVIFREMSTDLCTPHWGNLLRRLNSALNFDVP